MIVIIGGCLECVRLEWLGFAGGFKGTTIVVILICWSS